MIAGPPHNCGNCRFWVKVDLSINGTGTGQCRWGPPTAIPRPIQTIASPQPTIAMIGEWPLTGEGDACGRFQPIPIVTSPSETNRG